jgi:rhamnose transport system substrate-binding protein
MRKIFLYIPLAIILLFAGCGNNDTKAGTQTAARSGYVADEIINIYFIPKNMGNPYFDAVSSGFHNAIAQLGEENFKYTYTGPATAEETSQIPYIREAVEKGADAVFVAVNSNDALNAVFDEARRAGVRVYIINQDMPGSEAHRDAAIMPVDFDTIGAAQVELLGSQLGYRGQFAILSATREAPDQNSWIELMQKELKSNAKYARMQLAEIVYGDDQSEKSALAMEGLIEKYPGLNGVIVPTAVGLPAACKVLMDKGFASKIKITGLGLPSQMEEFIDSGL